ncbi:MAG: hypothetical protein AAF125_18410, partial [Chloroflexota bacterium]
MSCGASYPAERSACPHCATVSPVVVTVPGTVQVDVMLHTSGNIIEWRVFGNMVDVLTHEDGKVVLYRIDKHRDTRRTVLFNVMPDAQYVFLEDLLVVSPSREDESILVVDVSGDTPVAVITTTSVRYGGGRVMFDAGARHLYRLAGGFLMRGAVEDGQFVESPLFTVAEGQAWFTANPLGNEAFGFNRVFDEQHFWLYADGGRYDVDLRPLPTGAVMRDIDVKFASGAVLIARRVSDGGREFIIFDEIDWKGRLLRSRELPDSSLYESLGTYAYGNGVVLVATDSGISQLRLDNSGERVFGETEPVVRAGDSVARFGAGLLVVQDQRLLAVTM